ncbi:type II toxin-antitoxin system VapC family toxin [bacterium CPR1]|nr:type II toxin-antitoxin system VapC family toxin [bacterium CPR1]
MSYLLDTNVCIHYLNGQDEGLRERLLACSPDEVFLCSVVKAELLFGARKSERVSQNLHKLGRFFEPLQSLPFSDEAAERYGVLRAQLEHVGKPVGANDMLIAAIALASDLTLVTRNLRELRRIPGLLVELW